MLVFTLPFMGLLAFIKIYSYKCHGILTVAAHLYGDVDLQRRKIKKIKNI